MKNDYESRALKFAALLVRLFADCLTYNDFQEAILWYNAHHSMPIHYDHGVSRIAIMRADYVIKFNYYPDACWRDEEDNCIAGDNASERMVYECAVKEGYAHLLAKTTTVIMGGRVISIMPRISHVHDESKYWGDYVSDDEYDWLTSHIYDLHEGNVGYYRGKPIVIDYGWNVPNEY